MPPSGENTLHSRLCNTFTKYLGNLTRGQFKTYAPPEGNNTLGKAIYNEQNFTLHSLAHIFKMKVNEWEKQKTHIGLKELQQLIKNQLSCFPTSRDFDYTQISRDITMELQAFFDPQLVHFIDTITKSTNASKETSSALYEDLHQSGIKMIIGLLCFTMNPQCCFIQTLVGLMFYMVIGTCYSS